MLGLIGVVGGAAALEIRRSLAKGKGGEEKQIEELKKAVDQAARDLDEQRHAALAAARRAAGLEAQTEKLRTEAGELRAAAAGLSRQRDELAAKNAELRLDNAALDARARVLQGETHELAARNAALTAQVADLRIGTGAAAELAALRDAVAGVLSRLLAREIDEAAAAAELRDLGVEVRCAPPSAGKRDRRGKRAGAGDGAGAGAGLGLSFTPRLLLEDPVRIARLMHAAAAAAEKSAAANPAPRLLEGPSAATASGGKEVARAPRAMLTLASGSGDAAAAAAGAAGGAAGGAAPFFTLSWLGGAGGSGTSNAASAEAVAAPAVAAAAAGAAKPKPALEHAAAKAPASGRGRAPAPFRAAPKAAAAGQLTVGGGGGIDDGADALVFAAAPGKASNKQQQQQRAGLTFGDALGAKRFGKGARGGGAMGADGAGAGLLPSMPHAGGIGGDDDRATVGDLVLR